MCKAFHSHVLCITVSFDSHLTIKFPHPEWAEYFYKCYTENAFHKAQRTELCIRGSDLCHVRMKLPGSVDRVQMREPSEGLVLVFNDSSFAKRWLDNSKLFEEKAGERKKLTLKTTWSHWYFDQTMSCATSTRSNTEESGDYEIENKRGKFSIYLGQMAHSLVKWPIPLHLQSYRGELIEARECCTSPGPG